MTQEPLPQTPAEPGALVNRWQGMAGRAAWSVLDMVLPPRCAGCGMIVAGSSGFCPECWAGLDFLAGPACARCDLPLPAAVGAGALCGGCMADPPPYSRVRAVLAYGDAPRLIVTRLKYGRRMGFARLMARLMMQVMPPAESGAEAAPLLVPVPLHRWRIWSRGFNQSAEIAHHLARQSGMALCVDALTRTRRTPPLRGLGRKARAKTVQGVFTVTPSRRAAISGRTILLVDDVFTTGATTAACARALLRGGAARVEVLAFARVLDDPARGRGGTPDEGMEIDAGIAPYIDSAGIPSNIG